MSAHTLLDEVRSAMARDLKAALKARDSVATGALRAALGALDNATAVPQTSTPVAPGRSGEVARRRLDRDDIVALLDTESRERAEATLEYRRLGQTEQADRLDAEARIIRGCLRYVT